MTDHDGYRDHSAAFVLGALTGDERAGFEAHVGACDRCRTEVLEFAPLPALLSLVGLDDLVDPPRSGLADAVVATARDDRQRLHRSRRRWRATAGAVAVAASVLLALLVVGDDDTRPRPDADQVALTLDGSEDVTGEILADERAWGTYVHVSLQGLPERDRYRIWAIDTAGTWHETGSWLSTPDRSARLGASTHLRLSQIAQLVVTSDDVEDRLLVAH